LTYCFIYQCVKKGLVLLKCQDTIGFLVLLSSGDYNQQMFSLLSHQLIFYGYICQYWRNK